MTEKERILNNINGEIPDGDFDIVRVKEIAKPSEELETFKQTIIVFLENRNLNWESSQWERLLPRKLIQFTKQLDDSDYEKDDLITTIPNMINNLQDEDIREWEWYSSKVTDNGFEVLMTGIFRSTFLPLLHHQGISHKSMFIVRGGKEYPTRALTDVLSYKKFKLT